ncbi:MAG: M20/M25/M40 family metallo-hydrolase [Candidatus Kapaibacterium sp.]
MKKNIQYLLFAVLISMPLMAQNTETELNVDADVVSNLKTHVKYLASDDLAGRFPGTKGDTLAMRYIKSQFQGYGVKPVNGNYIQEFEVTTGVELGGINKFRFDVLFERPGVPRDMWRTVNKSWDVEKDYMPLSFSESGQITGNLIFAGYGISSKEQNYDDYADIDAEDQIVVVLTGIPGKKKDDDKFQGYGSLRYKATNAKNKGAKAIIFLNTQGDSANVLEELSYNSIGQNSGIIAVQAKRTSIEPLFPKGKELIKIENKINENMQPMSFIMDDITGHLNVNLRKKKQFTFNVMGYIKGTDPALNDEYIVIGAHYDHLGYGGPSSMYRGNEPMIHNGADDNASGVAGVLELARRFSENPPKRSVLFLGFSAEEMGLIGSAFFVNHSPIPLDKYAAMINLDMIGMMENDKINIFGLGSSEAFEPVADRIAKEHGLITVKADEAFGPSDHSSFYKEKVPVMMFFTGVHEFYHRPADDWDILNYEGLAKVIAYVEDVTREIADMSEAPVYTQVEVPTGERSGRSHGYGNVWFGIIPDFEENDLGARISGTSAGSPARIAGMQKDDIIVDINGKKIENLYDFMYMLKEHKAGDVLQVTVLRGPDNSQKKVLEVTLAEKK